MNKEQSADDPPGRSVRVKMYDSTIFYELP